MVHRHLTSPSSLRLLPRVIPSLVALLFSIAGVAYSSETYSISNAGELIAFSKSVNDGTNFSGTTVFLTEDIDFSSSTNGFEPIGKTESVNFAGVFDGQGHIIKNLVVSSSDFRFAGLFGYSVGLEIKNVVIDETCSFTSYFSSSKDSDAFVSSIIGFCEASSGKFCTIENVVSMADVLYRGDYKSFVIAGGIAAKCTGKCILNNCVNFGSVLTSSNEASSYIYFGGIVGEIYGSSECASIKNCVNYGFVTNDMHGDYGISVGGIAGIIGSNVAIENCLSTGPVSSAKPLSGELQIGSIIGGRKYNSLNNTIRNSFWTESVGDWNASGEAIENVTLLNVTGTSLMEMNESSINTLYNLMEASGESNFAIAHLNGGRIGNSTSDTLILHRSHIPAPVKEGRSFISWCTDSNCSEKCYGNSSSPCNSRDIYALWTTVITFLTNDDNNNTITKYLEFGQPIEFPENPVKEGHSFVRWDNTTSTVPAMDITISAIWTINNYTLIFDFDNGTEPEVRTIKFNEPIEYPEDPKKEGYRFIGWNNNITSMPARNLTNKALWEYVGSPTNFVNITFGTADLSEDKIKAVIKEYVSPSAEFEIIRVSGENGETVAIVKFVDANEAKSFVETISESSEKGRHGIKDIGFVDGEALSFSLHLLPAIYLYFAF